MAPRKEQEHKKQERDISFALRVERCLNERSDINIEEEEASTSNNRHETVQSNDKQPIEMFRKARGWDRRRQNGRTIAESNSTMSLGPE